MSKGKGQKIAIKFDKPLINVATTPPEGYPELKASEGTPTASNQYSSSYSADKVFDGSTSSYWQTRATLPQWIQIQTTPIALTRFRWYTGSYAPNQFELYGSQNGTDFVLLYAGNNASSTGWKSYDIPNSISYSYYRWNIISGHSSRIYLYEIEMFYKEFQDEGAFTITGMVRNPLEVGELELRTFTPYAIERYPVAILYEGDFSGTFDGVEFGGNGIKLPNSKIVEDFENESYSLNITGTWQRSSRAFYQGGFSLESDNKTHGSDASSYITFTTPTAQKVSLWYRVSSEYRYDKLYIYLNDEVKVDGISGAGDWQFAEWDAVAGENTIRVRYTKDGSSSANLDAGFIDLITVGVDEYSTPGSYIITTPTDALPTNSYIKWAENLPAGTSITAEYAVNQDGLSTPTTWTPISNSGLLTIPDTAGHFLWLKYTLATTDTSVTPTLLSVWLESTDTILLSFDTYNRFNDVEGDITVAYNQSLGTLAGTRPVESFSVNFTPTDLEPTPIDEHTITAGIDITANLIDLEFTEIYADHTVTHTATAGIDVTVALINIEDINP